MKNPFDRLTNLSIDRPRTSIVAILSLILVLSMFVAGPIAESMGVGIQFDNSEDAFYPDRNSNEDVDLLYQIEETYTSSIDIIRILVNMEKGDLLVDETWEILADIEAEMMSHNQSLSHRLDTGAGSVLGPASAAYGWSIMVDPNNGHWLNEIQTSLDSIYDSSSENLSDNLNQALNVTLEAPLEVAIANSSNLQNWTPNKGWIERLVSGENRIKILDSIFSTAMGIKMDSEVSLEASQNEEFNQSINTLQGAISGITAFHLEMQKIPYFEFINATLPSKEQDKEGNYIDIASEERLAKSDIITISLFVDTDIETWLEAEGTDPDKFEGDELSITNIINNEVQNWTLEMENNGKLIAGEDFQVSGLSFAYFSIAQTANIGAEIGQLIGMSILLLTIILFSQFRTVRDTAFVLISTILGILGTYGISGILNLTFNAAMNSIPILLIAIGVDYGIHVVARYRELLREEEENNFEGRETLRDFSTEVRTRAVRNGAILTSGALLIAIFTDMIGFLSFRFASQKFLVDFGTVIAIGLFMIYLLSITLLPALLTVTKPSKLKINKAARINPGPISQWFGNLTKKPFTVLIIALFVSLPIGSAVSSLEVGFETRDQLDESIPVVSDFMILSDRYESSPAPIYVQFIPNGEIFSSKGWESIGLIEDTIKSTKGTSDVTSIRSTLEAAANSNPEIYQLLDEIQTNPEDSDIWQTFSDWVLLNETGRELTARYLPENPTQTVIQLSASTIDWKETVIFENRLTESLSDLDFDGEFGIAGRPLVLAQVTEGVASSAVISTGVVAGVILIMLIGLQTVEQKSPRRGMITGLFMWIPLGTVVVWVYGLMGMLGYELNAQTVTIGALTLGLGVDYAVHYAHRYEEERQASPLSTPDVWVSRTTVTTGRAMAGAAITTAGGFAVLNLSGLLPLRLFGQVFLVAISLALLSSLILLPVLLSLRPGERESEKTDESE